MTSTRRRVGLLGAGYILQAHAKALQALPQQVELAAVCDVSRGRAEAAAGAFGIPGVYTSVDEMLAAGLDAVHVLLPPQLHVDITRQLLDAGVHVFVEKPMGLDSAACRVLAEQAQARGRMLGVNHNFLFLPAYERLRAQVKDGSIGRLDHVSLRWLYPLGLIQFAAFWQLFDATQVCAIGALRGYKITLMPMVLMLVSFWIVGVPIGTWLGYHGLDGEPMRVFGFWIGLVVGLVLVSIGLAIGLRRAAENALR